jgi:hypothetical protein
MAGSNHYRTGSINAKVGAGGVTRFARVKPSAGAPLTVVLAGSGEKGIGIAERNAAADDTVSIRLWSDTGSFIMVADGVIAAGAEVGPGASGKATAGPGLGYTVAASASDNDYVHFIPYPKYEAVAEETVTASGAINPAAPGTILDSTDGAITATLGSGTYVGQIKTISMQDASNASTVSVTNHVTSDPEVFTFDAVDEAIVLVWTGTEWDTLKATATA